MVKMRRHGIQVAREFNTGDKDTDEDQPTDADAHMDDQRMGKVTDKVKDHEAGVSTFATPNQTSRTLL